MVSSEELLCPRLFSRKFTKHRKKILAQFERARAPQALLVGQSKGLGGIDSEDKAIQKFTEHSSKRARIDRSVGPDELFIGF